MADNGWDRQIINVRERPLSVDINAAQSQLDRAAREVLMRLFSGRASATSDLATNPLNGFIGDAFKTRPQAIPSLSVDIAAGLGFQYLPGDVPSGIGGVNGLDDRSVYKPLPLLATTALLGLAGPAAGQDRYDIIEVRMNRVSGNPLSRDTLDTGTGIFTSGLVNKTLSFTLDGSTGQVTTPASSTAAISYKVGLAAGVGAAVEPPTTAGYVKIATIFSSNGNMTASITKANIIDRRLILSPYNKFGFHASCSVPSGVAAAPTLQAFNAPPGVEIAIFKSDIATPGQEHRRIKVYLLGSFSSAKAAASGTVLGSTSTQFNILTNLGTSIGVLNASDVTNLADATRTANPQTFAVGHPYISMEFLGTNQSSGVTSAPLAPMLVDIQGEILFS